MGWFFPIMIGSMKRKTLNEEEKIINRFVLAPLILQCLKPFIFQGTE